MLFDESPMSFDESLMLFDELVSPTVHGSGVAETTKLHNSNIAHFYSTYISVSAYILYITILYINHRKNR